MKGELTTRAEAIAMRTADAYSWDNYGERGWRACAKMLLKRGFDDRQTEAILRSKWTRWAADEASGRKGWRYGATTSADLGRFLDTQKNLEAQVADLVTGTFGSAS